MTKTQIEAAAKTYSLHFQQSTLTPEDIACKAFLQGVELVQYKWIPVSEGPPKGDGGASYPHFFCLIIREGEVQVRPWNVEHQCWDTEDMDDYDGDLDSASYYMPLSSISMP